MIRGMRSWTLAPHIPRLARLPGQQRAALTLRYLDDLPVTEVAAHLGRSLHATETLLVRARAALRRAYQEERDDG